MSVDLSKLTVKLNRPLDLDAMPTTLKEGVPNTKSERNALLAKQSPLLSALQDQLYSEGKRKILVVLQGMDTSGKDGTIRRVFKDVDPLGVSCASFKAPSSLELAHDYLWRVHAEVPKAGHMTIFNRSHYEDVLVTYVKKMIDKDELDRRIRHIVDFERMLTETGTVILKFFLHISKEEQRERLQERLDNPEKHWKFDMSDLEDRKLWDDFRRQYEYVMSRTSTEQAPWIVVPSDSKSTRNLVILQVLLRTLEQMHPHPPVVDTKGWPTKIE